MVSLPLSGRGIFKLVNKSLRQYILRLHVMHSKQSECHFFSNNKKKKSKKY